MSLITLLKDATAPALGAVQPSSESAFNGTVSFQAGVSGTGAVAAQVKIYGCNDARYPQLIFTLDLSGVTVAAEADRDDFPWAFYQAEVVSVSGLGAMVSVTAWN